MIILYFIPKIDKDNSTTFGNMLLNNIGNTAEAHLLTPRTEDIAHFEGIKIHYLSAYPIMIKRNKKRFGKVVNKIKPDIIHILGVWNMTASYIEKWALEKRIPVVISPLKGFAPWNIRHSYFTCKLPKLVMFQHKMAKNAHAMHALSRQEMEFVKNMAWHPSLNEQKPWNTHVCVIQNPEETNETSIAETMAKMARLYGKTIDSNPFLAMTDSDRMCENTLLRVGLATDNLSAVITQEAKELLTSIDEASWRRILLHAYDEKIYDFIIKGAMAMHMNRRSIDIEKIERFGKNTTAINEAQTSKGHKALKIIETYRQYETEGEICKMVFDVIYRMNHKALCRKHLAELYAKMRFNDYNEHILVEMLKRMNIKKSAARLMQIMNETMGLEMGFMPMEPLDDKKTNIIRNTLFKSEIQ